MEISAPLLPAPARAALDGVLADLVDAARSALGGDLVGCYLVGSFAMGAGDVYSDVDFLVITRTDVTSVQEAALADFHSRMPDSPVGWARHLEGSYPTVAEIRALTGSAWLYVDNGSRVLERSRHDNSAHARWILRSHGIALFGPEPATLVDPVTAHELRTEAGTTLESWRAELRQDPSGLANAWQQQHTVLGFCRILCTRETGHVVPKLPAGRWALDALDPRWHPLIRRAIADRPDPWGRVYRQAAPDLIAQTRDFVAADRLVRMPGAARS